MSPHGPRSVCQSTKPQSLQSHSTSYKKPLSEYKTLIAKASRHNTTVPDFKGLENSEVVGKQVNTGKRGSVDCSSETRDHEAKGGNDFNLVPRVFSFSNMADSGNNG